jgi:uncharacterized RDD family membrane protein YckC
LFLAELLARAEIGDTRAMNDELGDRARERRERARSRRKERRQERDETPRESDEVPDGNPYAPPRAPAPRKRKAKRDRRMKLASSGARFFNLFIDSLVMMALNVLAGLALGVGIFLGSGSRVGAAESVQLLGYALGVVVHFGYYCGCETLFGRTVGKLVTGTRVVAEDGSPPTFGAIAKRTLIRYVPFEAISFIGGGPGWHDQWSGTRVVVVKD